MPLRSADHCRPSSRGRVGSAPLLVFLSALPAVLTGCVNPVRPLHLKLNPDVVLPERAALLLFVDGFDLQHVQALIAAGKMPHIEEVFVDGGVRVDRAVTSLPPITYPNAATLITGVYPGHHGITGNYWFDRYSLVYHNYLRPEAYRRSNDDFRQPTIFEMLYDEFTFNLQCHTRRGVSHSFDNWMLAAWDWAYGAPVTLDSRVGADLADIHQIANVVHRWPTLILAYFPGVDEIGHRYGPHSRQYEQALVNIDLQVGRMAAGLREAGIYDRTYMVIVADHSMFQADRGRNFDLVNWLHTDCGMRVYTGFTKQPRYSDRFAAIDPTDVVAANDSARFIALHVRGKSSWSEPADPERMQRILERLQPGGLDAVECVCVHDPTGVRIIGKHGEMVVQRRGLGSTARYRVVATDDARLPEYESLDESAAVGLRAAEAYERALGFGGNEEFREFVAAGLHTSREWLAASDADLHPDFVPQIVNLFDTPHAGDIGVFSAPDWTFDRIDKGDHGSCVAHDMRIPLFFRGPDLPHGAHVLHGRNVDIVPTLLDLLGKSDRLEQFGPVDGVSIAPELRAAAGR